MPTLTPPGEGVDGSTVTGQKIPAPKSIGAKFPKGKNVRLSEDGSSLIAAKSGRVDYINGRIEVTDVFRVAGNVDMSTGNIQFDGDVFVTGDVISGLTIEASGAVEVCGYVEAARIVAGKDIILKNGMQGMDKGSLQAGGNIIARFLERSVIKAEGRVVSDSIVHCNVSAGDSVKMQGKWARILGGSVRANRAVIANTIGSISGESTVIDLGASPEMRAQYTKLATTKDELKAQLDKITMTTRVIMAKSDAAGRDQLLSKLAATREQLQQQYDDTASESEVLLKEIDELSRARLHVFKAIHPNVKVSINLCHLITKTSTKYVTFYYEDGRIASTSCEIRA